MNRKELIDMIECGASLVRAFLIDSDLSLSLNSSYEDWNKNDVVGHIVGWMNYSIDKLACIKLGTKQSDEYSQVTSLNEINTILYNKMKGKSEEEIESSYINSIGSYIKVISLFSNNDINLDTFETGFKMELWRYMLMDTVIHPIQHILYQYLKENEYGKIVSIISSTKEIFRKYSEQNKGYNLDEFEIERSEYQKKIKELEIEYKNNEDVNIFIKMNKKNA
jgi:hypothetical protein